MDLFLWVSMKDFTVIPMDLLASMKDFAVIPIDLLASMKDFTVIQSYGPIPLIVYSYDGIFRWWPIPMMAYSYDGLSVADRHSDWGLSPV